MKKNKKTTLVGIRGWLAVFVIGQIISVFIAIFMYFYEGTFSATDAILLNMYSEGLGDTLRFWIAVEKIMSVSIITAVIYLISIILKKRKKAKNYAILIIIAILFYTIVDYLIVSEIANRYDLDVSDELGALSQQIVRQLTYAVIWVPYLIQSKRVKNTFKN